MRRQEYHARDKTVKKIEPGRTDRRKAEQRCFHPDQPERGGRAGSAKTGGGYLFSWFGKRTGRKNSHEKKAETAALHS